MDIKNNIQYLVLRKDYANYRDKIIGFYKSEYNNSYEDKAIDNSAMIGFAMVGGEIVGAGRVTSDLSRHAQIVDLVINKSWRKQGIGSELVKRIVDKLKEDKVMFIGVVKDENYPWLKDFYTKIGFSSLPEDSYFELVFRR